MRGRLPAEGGESASGKLGRAQVVDVHVDDQFDLLSAGIQVKMRAMAKNNGRHASPKNGKSEKQPISQLGKDLRKLREQYIASGGKLLNRRELEREIAERRGSR